MSDALAPDNWRDQYALIRVLRGENDAPADEDYPSRLPTKQYGDEVFKFQCLVAAILCGQADYPEDVGNSFRKLMEAFPPLSADVISSEECNIKAMGVRITASFCNRKAQFIKNSAVHIMDKFHGVTPTTPHQLQEIPGVGVGTAQLAVGFMGEAKSIPLYDPRDYVHKVCKLLGWSSSEKPEQTRKGIEMWLPRKGWCQLPRLYIIIPRVYPTIQAYSRGNNF